MKTLKFRIYDGIKKAMEYRDMETIANLGWPLMEAKEAVQNGKVMMFTGLLDRLGKEIYDGDVVELETENSTQRWEVCFYDGSFGFARDDHFITFGYVNHGSDGIEVIGNIYENPDLLPIQPKK